MEAKLAKMVLDLDRQLSLRESSSSSSGSSSGDKALSGLFDLCNAAWGVAAQLPAQTKIHSRSVLQQLNSGVARLQQLHEQQKQQLQHEQQQQQLHLDEMDSGEAAFADDDNLFAETHVLASIRQQEEETLALMHNREAEVCQLTQDIVQLEEMFRKISEMVNEQGDNLQSIEANVDDAEVKVVEGKQQLEEAVKTQKSARKKKVLLVIIGVIAAVILVFVVFMLVKFYT